MVVRHVVATAASLFLIGGQVCNTQIYEVADLLRAFGNMSHEHESPVSPLESVRCFFAFLLERAVVLLCWLNHQELTKAHITPRLASPRLAYPLPLHLDIRRLSL